MSAVDTWLLATPKARGHFDGSADCSSKNPDKGQDFASVMQATLGPNGRGAFEKRSQQIQNGRQPKAALSDTASSTTVESKPACNPTTIGKSGAESKTEKAPVNTDSSNPTDPSGITANTQPPELPPPSIFSMPFFVTAPASIVPANQPAVGSDSSSPTQSAGGGSANPIAAIATANLPTVKGAGDNSPQTAPLTGADNGTKPSSSTDPANPLNLTPTHLETRKEPEHAPAKTADTPAALTPKIEIPNDPASAQVPTATIPEMVASLHESKAHLTGPPQPADIGVDDAGIGVANMGSLMKNLQKTNKVAGLDAKVLPVAQNGQSSGNNLPQLPVMPVRGTENHGSDLGFAFSNGNAHPGVADAAPVLNTLDLPSLADARIRALDRTHDMMALHSMRLVESKSDTLSVVIKPSIGTELSLELRQEPDGVKAHAMLMRGDHQFFSQHWGELQQKLEQRGIKLAPLSGEANFWSNNNGQFQQQQQTAQEDAAQQASAFAEFASVTQPGGATAKLVTARDGWESWA